MVAAAQAGDAAARATLIEAFLPLVAATARHYQSSRIEKVELLQEGVVGLLRALQRFDPDRGHSFGSYAGWWVRQAMQHLVAELTGPVVLSDRALRQLARVRTARAQFARRAGREPTVAELAEACDLSPSALAELLAGGQPARGLDEPVEGDGDSRETVADRVPDPLADEIYERVLRETQLARLRSLLGGLSERERAILRSRYGLDGPERTLREVADELGCSAERVRQLEQRALGKLRAGVGAV